jgi:Flp pilus assembly protein protease CpaA
LLTDWRTLLSTFVIGSVIGLALGLWPFARRWLQDTMSATLGKVTWLSTRHPDNGRHIPFGSALAAGFVWALQPAMSKL